MADIRNYLREKNKRENKKYNEEDDIDYKEKIRQHKRENLYKIILVVAIIVFVVIILCVQYKRHVYTGYDVVTSVAIEGSYGAANMSLGNMVLTYSKDGAHCTDSKGNVIWNKTFEMQDIQIATCNDAVAIGNYNGRKIYVADSNDIITEVETTFPIKDIAVSHNGRSTIVMTDSDTTWVNTYDEAGNQIYSGQTHMQNSGYPIAISLSPNGELLAVSYMYVDAGTVKSNVAFYNFGPVGANQSDYMVSAYTYTDLVIPFVKFINDNTCVAVSGSRVMIYKGGKKPESSLEHLYDEEIKAIYTSDKYLGVVLMSEDQDYLYKMDVYDSNATLIGTYKFDIDYTDLFFEEHGFVAYNETECCIVTLDGVEKFNGIFEKGVKLMTPTAGSYKYIVVTEDSFDTIQLK